MHAFQVNDMSCGHCVGAIKQAAREVDPARVVEIDLATHSVRIDSTKEAAAFAAAIDAAGYTPNLM